MGTTLAQRQTKPFIKWRNKAQVRATWMTVALLLCAVYSISVNSLSIGNLLTRTYPLDPQATALVVDAARVTQGTFHQNDMSSGVKSNAYGWATPYALAAMTHFAPLSNGLGRYLALFSALCLCSLFTGVFARGESLVFKLFAFTTFLGIHTLCGELFAFNRADTTAMLFCSLFVMVFYHGSKKENLAWVALSCILLLIGVAFKPTATAWALIPPLAVLFEGRGRVTKTWVWALIPVFSIAFYFTCLKILNPAGYLVSTLTPTDLQVPAKALLRMLWTIVVSSPLFVALTMVFLVGGKPKASYGPWIRSALCILFVACAALAVKRQDGTNQLLPLYFVVAAYCVDALRHYFTKPNSKLGLTGALLTLWLVQSFPAGPILNRYYLLRDKRQEHYTQTVNYVATLQGKVISPEDPTIPLMALGTTERNFFIEWDALRGWDRMPPELVSYLSSADYIVDSYDWMGGEMLMAPMFESAGFVVDRDFGSYLVWKKL